LALGEFGSESKLLFKLDEIIKSNKVFLSKLINKGELSQIGDNDSGRLFYYSFNEDKPLEMSWLLELIENLYLKDDTKQIELKFTKEINRRTPSFDGYKVAKH